MILQKEISLQNYARGYHLITEILYNSIKEELPDNGLLNVFIKHTSAGLTLNENADYSVRNDFESFVNKLIPENDECYTHTYEGEDDMPAHLKSSIIGQSITIPITNKKLSLGTWQGIYFCEFRNYGGIRKIVLTIYS